MSFKSWFFLGISFGALKTNWLNSEVKFKCSLSEQESINDAIEQIEDNILEENWREPATEFCIQAIQLLRAKLHALDKKYNVVNQPFIP